MLIEWIVYMVDSLRLQNSTDKIIGCFQPFKRHDTTEHNRPPECYKYVTLWYERFQVYVELNGVGISTPEVAATGLSNSERATTWRENQSERLAIFRRGKFIGKWLTSRALVNWLSRSSKHEMHSRHSTETRLCRWENRNVVNSHAHNNSRYKRNPTTKNHFNSAILYKWET